jgi:DNA gyrase/topoisomerase IV subunit B
MQKAKIDIQSKNRRSYTNTAYAKLNHQIGSVVEINDIDGLKTARVLIEFDKPIDGFHTHGLKHTYFGSTEKMSS